MASFEADKAAFEADNTAQEFDSGGINGGSLLHSVLVGVSAAVIVAAVVMIAYLLMPGGLVWTVLLAIALAVLLFIALLYVPYREEVLSGNLVRSAQPDPRLLADTSVRQREEQIEAVEKLREEAKAAKDVLADTNQERMPMKWASAMENLGQIYLELAILEKAMLGRRADVLTLKQAGGAFRKGLLKRTLEKTPQEWALAMLGLGTVSLMMGERSSSVPHLEEAITAFTESLKGLTEEKNPGKPAEAISGITRARQVLVEIRQEEERVGDSDDDIF